MMTNRKKIDYKFKANNLESNLAGWSWPLVLIVRTVQRKTVSKIDDEFFVLCVCDENWCILFIK